MEAELGGASGMNEDTDLEMERALGL